MKVPIWDPPGFKKTFSVTDVSARNNGTESAPVIQRDKPKTFCSGLDLKWLPKDLCAKGLFPSVAPLGGIVKFKRWDLVGGLQVTGGHALKEDCATLLLSFSSFFFCCPAISWVVLLYHTSYGGMP